MEILQPRRGPAPWLLICAPNLLGTVDSDVYIVDLPEDRIVILELNILRHQPQPNWPQLIKVNRLLIISLLFFFVLTYIFTQQKFFQVISTNDYIVSKILLNTLIHECADFTSEDEFNNLEKLRVGGKCCGGFLCNDATCDRSLQITSVTSLYSLMYILTCIAEEPGHVIVPALMQHHEWSRYLDRQQVLIQIFKKPHT